MALADDHKKIEGIWKLVSLAVESQATGEKEYPMGKHPTGYVIFTPERVMFVLAGAGRKAGKTVQERADLLNSLIAYTGTYRLEGDNFITAVDVSWDPAWIGTEQKRFFKIDGKRLQVITAWLVNSNWPEKGVGRGIVTFERV